MKTEMEKMRSGELYRFDDEEMQASFARAKRLCAKLNRISTVHKGYRKLIEALVPEQPKYVRLFTATMVMACTWASIRL